MSFDELSTMPLVTGSQPSNRRVTLHGRDSFPVTECGGELIFYWFNERNVYLDTYERNKKKLTKKFSLPGSSLVCLTTNSLALLKSVNGHMLVMFNQKNDPILVPGHLDCGPADLWRDDYHFHVGLEDEFTDELEAIKSRFWGLSQTELGCLTAPKYRVFQKSGRFR
jgi:hypothetical protein